MDVPHDHLKCPVPEQLSNCAQIHTDHYKSTGNRMAVAMPRIPAPIRGAQLAGRRLQSDPGHKKRLRPEERDQALAYVDRRWRRRNQSSPGRTIAELQLFRLRTRLGAD